MVKKAADKNEKKPKTPKVKAKAKATTENVEALEIKKEQQNFVNTLKYRANQCHSTEAQQLLQAPPAIHPQNIPTW